MAPPPRRLLASAPPILVGIAACLLSSASPQARPLSDSTVRLSSLDFGGGARARAILLYLQARDILAAGSNHWVALLFVLELCFLALVYILLGALEACALRARPCALSAVPLFQIIPGPRVSFSVVWLPSNLLGCVGAAGTRKPAESLHRFFKSTVAFFSFISIPLFVFAMIAHKNQALGGTLSVNIFLSAVSQMVWQLLVHRPSARSAAARPPEEALFADYALMAAFAALVWRFFGLALFFDDPFLPSQLLEAFITGRELSDFAEAAVRFAVVNLSGIALTYVYYALLEDGPRVALCTVVGALALGPAAAFARYCTYRERKRGGLDGRTKQD